MIVQDEGGVPWWRLLWSLLGALLIGMMGYIALVFDIHDPSPLHVAIEFLALPFFRLGHIFDWFHSDIAFWAALIASVLVWWGLIFALLARRARGQHA